MRIEIILYFEDEFLELEIQNNNIYDMSLKLVLFSMILYSGFT